MYYEDRVARSCFLWRQLYKSASIFQVRAVPTPSVEWRWQGQRIRNGSLTNVGSAVFVIREEASEVAEVAEAADVSSAASGALVGQRTSNLTVVRADLEHGGEYVCVGKNSAGIYTAFRILNGSRFCPTKIDHISDRSHIPSILLN